MSTKSALRADLDAEDRKTLAEDRKRMERLSKGSQLDDWLAFGPGLLIRRRLAKNIAGLAETDLAKGHRYSRAFKEQMEMDGLYDRTTKSDVMKSTLTAVLWFYDDEKQEERRREVLEEIRRNMTPGQRARFNSPISAQQRVLDELRTRGLAPAKKPRAPKPADNLDVLSSSAEPPGPRHTNGDGNFEAFKSRWAQCCEADFAALPPEMKTRFVTEVLNMSVPSGDTSCPVSPPSLPFSVQAAAMMSC
jgi:hypothetical protein